MYRTTLACLALCIAMTACKDQPGSETQVVTDAPAVKIGPSANTYERSIRIVRELSSDEMAGRETGTPGGVKAREYLSAELDKIAPPGSIELQTFEVGEVEGVNLIIKIDVADTNSGPALVAMAHYDHIGVDAEGEVFNGADDNASGVGALVAMLESYAEERPAHDVYLAWLDAEEMRLSGARALIERLPDRPYVALNFDMIAQNEDGVIYAAGTHHTPALKPIVEQARAGSELDVRFGHDRPEYGDDDWTMLSDHGPFHTAGVPFLYLGVEDHAHYHKVSDEFETLPLDVYRRSLDLAVATARALDAALPGIARPIVRDDTP